MLNNNTVESCETASVDTLRDRSDNREFAMTRDDMIFLHSGTRNIAPLFESRSSGEIYQVGQRQHRLESKANAITKQRKPSVYCLGRSRCVNTSEKTYGCKIIKLSISEWMNTLTTILESKATIPKKHRVWNRRRTTRSAPRPEKKTQQTNQICNVPQASYQISPTCVQNNKSSSRVPFPTLRVQIKNGHVNDELSPFTKKLGKRFCLPPQNVKYLITRTRQSYLAQLIILSLLLGFVMGSDMNNFTSSSGSYMKKSSSSNKHIYEGKQLEGAHQIGNHHDIMISNSNPSDIQPIVSNDSKTHTYTLRHDNASYLSVHFESMDLPPGCFLEIEDIGGNQSERLSGNGYLDLRYFWGHHVSGDTMNLVLQCDTEIELAIPIFSINNYVAGYPNQHFDSRLRTLQDRNDGNPFAHHKENRDLTICEADNKLHAICYKDEIGMYKSAQAVARLIIRGSGSCTGWLVHSTTGNMLITNNHCISTEDDVQNTSFEFNLEADSCSDSFSTSHPLSYQGVIFDGIHLLATDFNEDFSLIRLVGNPAAEYGQLKLDLSEPEMNQILYIPQHPGGRHKEIASLDDNNDSCKVINPEALACRGGKGDMSYNCDTEGGSSGSPVLTSNHEVIGLHHCGGGCKNKGVPISNFHDKISGYLGGCVRYGDRVILQVNNVDSRWLTGGRGKNKNRVWTRDNNLHKPDTYHWILRSASGSGNRSDKDTKHGECVRYGRKIFFQISNIDDKYLTGGRDDDGKGVYTYNFGQNYELTAKAVKWTVRSAYVSSRSSIDPRNGDIVNYGDKPMLQNNSGNNLWLTGGLGEGSNDVSTDSYNEFGRWSHKWTLRSIFGTGERKFIDPFTPRQCTGHKSNGHEDCKKRLNWSQ